VVYNLSKEQYNNIYDSAIFLKRYNNNEFINNLGKVVVIGGGNVAMDCARCATKMNAESVTILYRRNRENMPARDIEIEDALKDGVQIQYLTKVLNVIGQEGKIEKVECIKTQLDDSKIVDVEDSNFFVSANTVVFAIGSMADKELLEGKTGLSFNDKFLSVDEEGKTSIEGVFAGGDLINNKATVCRAVASGKIAANGIINYLKNK